LLLEIEKSADVAVPQATAWALVRDVPRLTACIPGLTDLREIEPDRLYTATVSEKLGPFKLSLPGRVEIKEIEEPSRIVAELTGSDTKGAARVRGTLEATLEPADEGARLVIRARLDVLGKLAALGAAPMRRRAGEIFNQFTRCLTSELSAEATAGGSRA
jgi:carbon monoxide dehydrogenase subunit G